MSVVCAGIIIGMIYQAVLLYIFDDTDDEILEKIIIGIEAFSVVLFFMIALKGAIS